MSETTTQQQQQQQQQQQKPNRNQRNPPAPSRPCPPPLPPSNRQRSQSQWKFIYKISASQHSASLWRVVRSPHGCRAPLKPRFWGPRAQAKPVFYSEACMAAHNGRSKQFFYHDFPKSHQTTTRRKVYKNCLVCDTCIRELMVLDVPPQKRFPADNFAEWNNGHPLGLRTVHAYVLVFDMGNLETFQYCRSMRDQILDSFSHRDFSIIVVGNKYDTITEAQANSQELKDISTLVRKHWRCGYVECSAQYNYKIGDVFRELMGCTSTGGPVGTEYSQSSRNKGRCTIL